jgi:hypothetical protein
MDAETAIAGLMNHAGDAVSAYNLSGKSAEEKATSAFARLRDRKVQPRSILERSLAVAAYCAAQGIDNRQKEYRHVQMAKAVHRLASGTHKTTSGFKLKSKYPRSEGSVLRLIGKALDDILRFHFHHTDIVEISQSLSSKRVLQSRPDREIHPARLNTPLVSSPLMPPSGSSWGDGEDGGQEIEDYTLHFDPWLSLKEALHQAVLEPFLAQLLSADTKRLRRPKADALERMRAMVSTILANFIKLSMTMPEGSRLAVSVAHNALSRYDRTGLGQLPKLLDLMCSAQLAIKTKAEWKAKRTRFAPTGRFRTQC